MTVEELRRAVRHIEIRTRRSLAGPWWGLQHSLFEGRGLAFAEVRLYQPGDDVRSIDWKVTARTGEVSIKTFSEERERTFWLVVDQSPSMAFGSTDRTKRMAAAEAAAWVALVGVRHGDRVGMVTFGAQTPAGGAQRRPAMGGSREVAERSLAAVTPVGRGRRHALRIVRELLADSGADDTRNIQDVPALAGPIRDMDSIGEFDAAIQSLSRHGRQRSVVFLLSDFLFDVTSPRIGRIGRIGRRHQVFALHLLDPLERRLPNLGLVRWRDAETGRAVVVDTGSQRYRQAYEEAARLRIEQLRRRLARRGIEYVSIPTDHPVGGTLVDHFRHRPSSGRRAWFTKG